MPAQTLITAELTSRLRLVVARLNRRLRQEAGSADVSPSQLAALGTVERRGPLTLGELAAHERVQPPTMTRIVAALEVAGLVTRTVDPTDRRVARVAISAAGLRFLDKHRSRRNAYLARRLRTLSPAELATVERALPLLERLIEDDE